MVLAIGYLHTVKLRFRGKSFFPSGRTQLRQKMDLKMNEVKLNVKRTILRWHNTVTTMCVLVITHRWLLLFQMSHTNAHEYNLHNTYTLTCSNTFFDNIPKLRFIWRRNYGMSRIKFSIYVTFKCKVDYWSCIHLRLRVVLDCQKRSRSDFCSKLPAMNTYSVSESIKCNVNITEVGC